MITEITLPFPVTVNALYGGGSGQQRFPSKRYKAWLKSCPILEQHRFDNVKIWYMFYFPDHRSRDTMNYEKCVTDYLVKQKVIIDDNWKIIKDSHITPMVVCKENPRVEIRILSQ